MNPPKIPIVVVTGFLGSGKTTLVNRLLRHWSRPALIINEFGAMPIDQQLVADQNIPMAILSGGCLCCQIKGSLAPLLKNLWMKWREDPEGTFDHILIETSGVASPEPVLDTLLREPWLARRYRLLGVITTISVPAGLSQLQRFPEAKAQVIWADTLVMTQTDLASHLQITQLETRLEQWAPATPRLIAKHGEMDLQRLFPDDHRVIPLRRLQPGPLPDHGFHSVSIRLETRLPWCHLQAALEKLRVRHGRRLVRIKGVVHVDDYADPISVQADNFRLHPPTRLSGRAMDDRVGRLVFISHGKLDGLPDDLIAAAHDFANRPKAALS